MDDLNASATDAKVRGRQTLHHLDARVPDNFQAIIDLAAAQSAR
jgi:hypothetical protein